MADAVTNPRPGSGGAADRVSSSDHTIRFFWGAVREKDTAHHGRTNLLQLPRTVRSRKLKKEIKALGVLMGHQIAGSGARGVFEGESSWAFWNPTEKFPGGFSFGDVRSHREIPWRWSWSRKSTHSLSKVFKTLLVSQLAKQFRGLLSSDFTDPELSEATESRWRG